MVVLILFNSKFASVNVPLGLVVCKDFWLFLATFFVISLLFTSMLCKYVVVFLSVWTLICMYSQWVLMCVCVYVLTHIYIYIYISYAFIHQCAHIFWMALDGFNVCENVIVSIHRCVRTEFKSWTRLFAFHIALITLGKVWIQLFFLQI